MSNPKPADPPAPPASGNRRVDQGLQSRARLVAEARRLFERDGYAATSTEALLASTGLTRGALYHHFRDKKDLFIAVCEAVHADLAQAIEAATAGLIDAQAQLLAGSAAWIEAVSAPGPRQVLLIDAPAVGAAEWQALDERHGFRLLREAVLQIVQPEGSAAERRADALAAALNGAINALVHWRARHDGPASRVALHAALQQLCAAVLKPDTAPPARRARKPPEKGPATIRPAARTRS
jgi:AcrR family transcriptional regulator